MGRIISYLEAEERYPALRVVAMAFSGIGAVLVLLGALLLVFGLWSLMAGQPPRGDAPIPQQAAVVVPVARGLSGGLAVLLSLGFLVSGIQFLAMGALVGLAIHVEENTRATAQCLEKLCSRLEARDAVGGPLFVS